MSKCSSRIRLSETQSRQSSPVDLPNQSKTSPINQDQMSTLALSFREQIRDRHKQNVAIDEQLRVVLLQKLNLVREIGILASDAASALDKFQFAKMTKEVGIDQRSLQAYRAFADEHQSPITEVENGMRSMRGLVLALQSGGLLPFAADGHGVQKLHQNPNFIQQVIQTASGLAHRIRQQLKREPLKSWDRNAIENLLAGLKPVVSVSSQLEKFLR